MPSYGSYLFFPIYILTGSDGGEEFLTSVTTTDGSESRNQRWLEGRANINLAGAKLTLRQHKRWVAFRRVLIGMKGPVLFLDVRDYTIEDENGNPSVIGTGDGATTAFQIKKTLTEQGRTVSKNIYFPDHDYPPLLLDSGVQFWPNLSIANPLGANVAGSNYISIYVNGVLKTLGADYTVARETGIVTFVTAPANDAIITCSGYYYILVRFTTDLIRTRALGGGTFEIASGAVVEPKGHK